MSPAACTKSISRPARSVCQCLAPNFPKLVARPAYAQLLVPEGFKVGCFAKDLEGPRHDSSPPNGDIFLTETRGGFVKVLHPSAGRRSAPDRHVRSRRDSTCPLASPSIPKRNPEVAVRRRNQPRRALRLQGRRSEGERPPEIVVPELSPVGSGRPLHSRHRLLPGRQAHVRLRRLRSNVAEDMTKKTPEEVKDVGSRARPGRDLGPGRKSRRRARVRRGQQQARQGVRDRHPQLRRPHDATRPQATCGARRTSATCWVMTSCPTTRRA